MTTWTCDRCFRLVAIELTSCPWCHPPKKAEVAMPHAHSLFEEAHRTIAGDRRTTYSPYEEEAPRVAAIWSAILKHPVEPRQVALMMMGLKLERLACSRHKDSLVDLVGYAGLLAELEEAKS